MARRLAVFQGWNKRKTWWRLVALLTVVLVMAVGWHASLRAPTGPAEGGLLCPPGPAGPAQWETFRLGVFNIHRGRGPDGRLDLDRTAAAISGLDFVGLNEVGGRWPWEAADQAEQLGKLAGRAFLFAPFERRWYCYEFGNGLLSSQPITSWRRLPLGEGHTRPRNVLLATVGDGNRRFQAIVVHASRRDAQQREEEFRSVFELFLAASLPVALLGDLNAASDDPQLHRLLATPGVIDALDQPGIPRRRIEWILVRGLKPVRAAIVDQGASDHPLFWAEVRLEPGVQ